MGLGRGDARVLDRRGGDLFRRNRARLLDARRRRLAFGNLTAAGDCQAIADIDLGIGLDVVGARQCHKRDTISVRDPHQAFAGLDDMNAFGLLRRRRAVRGRLTVGRGRNVARNHQPLARPDGARIADAVGLHDGGGRHAVFVRDGFHGLSGADDHRRAAIPGPMAGGRRRRWWRTMRGHRSGDLGYLMIGGPVGAQALRAGGNAARTGDGGGPGRRRQRLRDNAARGRRLRGNRAGIVWRRRPTIVGGVRIGIEARGVRTTGGGNADQGEDRNARPGTQARRHVRARHMVTH